MQACLFLWKREVPSNSRPCPKGWALFGRRRGWRRSSMRRSAVKFGLLSSNVDHASNLLRSHNYARNGSTTKGRE